MSSWVLLFLLVWFLGTCAGTVLAITMVRGGSTRPAPIPNETRREDRERAA